MRRATSKLVLAATAIGTLAITIGAAEAAPKKKKATDDASATSASSGAGVAASSSVGKAITPYDQQMIDANKAMAAGIPGGALDDAIAAYRKAITIDSTRGEAYLFLGAALFQKGDYPAADQALSTAAMSDKKDPTALATRGRAMFLQAMSLEAQGKNDEAKTAWQAYGTFAKDNPDQDPPKGAGAAPPMTLKVYPGSAIERESKIELNVKMREEYGKVKVLVEKRQRELGEEPKK